MRLKNYDPNITWGTQTVVITYQQWDYTAQFEVEISGNCKGASILDSAISRHAEAFETDRGVMTLNRLAEDGSGEFDTLTCESEDLDIERWLQSMCVGLHIVRQVAEKRGEAQ